MKCNDTVVEQVVDEFRERSKFGEKKYGTTLDRDDLSFEEWIQHLKEELMDALVYVTRCQREITKKK